MTTWWDQGPVWHGAAWPFPCSHRTSNKNRLNRHLVAVSIFYFLERSVDYVPLDLDFQNDFRSIFYGTSRWRWLSKGVQNSPYSLPLPTSSSLSSLSPSLSLSLALSLSLKTQFQSPFSCSTLWVYTDRNLLLKCCSDGAPPWPMSPLLTSTRKMHWALLVSQVFGLKSWFRGF